MLSDFKRNGINLFNDKENTRAIIDKVVKDVTDAVISTMGPNGKYVCISNLHDGTPKVTKDGVTVAANITYDDPAHRAIARIITDAAIKTDNDCGDGTTTTVLITSYIYNLFKDDFTYVKEKQLISDIKKVINYIKSKNITVNSKSEILKLLALTSANQDKELVDVIFKIINDFDFTPDILFKEGIGLTDIVEHYPPLTYYGGYSSPQLQYERKIGKQEITCFNSIIINGFVNTISQETINVLRTYITESDKVPLLLFARGFDNKIIEVINQLNNHFPEDKRNLILPVNLQVMGSVGDYILDDIAHILDTYLHLGNEIPIDIVDFFNDATQKPSSGTVVIGNQYVDFSQAIRCEDFDEHVNNAKEMYNSLTIEKKQSPYGQLLSYRYKALVGGRVTVFVGGITPSDIKERQDRFTDTYKAIRSALQMGVIKGCGSVLINYLYENPIDKDNKLVKLLIAPYIHLYDDDKVNIGKDNKVRYKDLSQSNEELLTESELNVYDTTLALINALEGGLQTAITLIKLNNIVLTEKNTVLNKVSN